ncbi:MAG: aldo/keto reductase, partial [Alcanivoracaceae bacterium]|nr:aldo/keto reductase [Alcanivoracaceae bacterium]
TVAGGLAALEQSDVAMVTANLHYHDEQPVIDYAAAHNKGILIKKAFASGHLFNDTDNAMQQTFRHLLGTPGVTSIIAGTINPAHLRDNVEQARKALDTL